MVSNNSIHGRCALRIAIGIISVLMLAESVLLIAGIAQAQNQIPINACEGIIGSSTLTVAGTLNKANFTSVSPAGGGIITGRVTMFNGTPVAFASVSASGPGYYGSSISTDVNGSYTISGFLAGTYIITVSPPYESNLISNSTIVHVSLNETVRANIILQTGGIITGRVTMFNGTPVAFASVCVSGQGYKSNSTDVNGNYTISGLSAGNYTVYVYHPFGSNLVSNSTNVSISLGETVRADIILQTGGIITGRVTTVDGIPVAFANVCVSGPLCWWQSIETIPTGINGNYTISGLSAGNYTVYVNPPSGSNLASNSTNVSISLGETVRADIILQTGGIITGRVTTVNGTPVAFASVHVSGPGYGGSYTDVSGNYMISGLHAGNYTVYVYPPVYPPFGSNLASNSTDINVKSGETSIANIILHSLMGPVRPQSIVVSPSTASLTLGGTQRFNATAQDQNNNPMLGINISWTISNSTVGSVTPLFALTGSDGNASTTFNATATGTDVITATNGNVAGITNVTVTSTTPANSSISGTVTNLSSGSAISGATVTTDGMINTTDANGNYSISIAPGTYNVTANATGYQNNTTTGIVVTSGNVTTQDFALIPAPKPRTFNISGFVIDIESGHGIAGWLISDENATTSAHISNTTTDATGFYQIPNLTNGTYTVSEETKAPLVPTGPTSQNVTIAGHDVTNVNFTNTPATPTPTATGSISGSEINVATGTGIPNVTVRLVGIVGTGVHTRAISMTTLTGSTGNWMFNNLPAGRYIIIEQLPNGFIPVTLPVMQIKLAPGQNSMNNNFRVNPISALIPKISLPPPMRAS